LVIFGVEWRTHLSPRTDQNYEILHTDAGQNFFFPVQRGLSIRVFEWLFKRIAEEEATAVPTPLPSLPAFIQQIPSGLDIAVQLQHATLRVSRRLIQACLHTPSSWTAIACYATCCWPSTHADEANQFHQGCCAGPRQSALQLQVQLPGGAPVASLCLQSVLTTNSLWKFAWPGLCTSCTAKQDDCGVPASQEGKRWVCGERRGGGGSPSLAQTIF